MIFKGTGEGTTFFSSGSSQWKILIFFTVIMSFSVISGLNADEADLVYYRNLLSNSAFPENDETRRLLSDAISSPAFPAVETQFKFNRQLSDGRMVQFEVRKTVRDWYLIFRNQRGDEPWENYPIWGRGSWVIKKDLLTGSFVQAKIFLQDDENSFVRLFPTNDGRSRLDVHLYGKQLGENVIIPVSFEELMLTPFARIAALTNHSVNWEILFPDSDAYGYRKVKALVSSLAIYDDSIVEIRDAAVDGAGLNVFIESGKPIRIGEKTADGGILEKGKTGMNCSGYVKWIADGLYSAWSGFPGSRYLSIESLRQPTSLVNRNPWSESRSASGRDARDELDALLRDPRFGLDWNRNLARIVEESRLGKTLRDDEIQALDTGELDGIPFWTDLGYKLEDLPSALYQLAAVRPGSVFLAAVNSRFLPEPTDADPNPVPLHQYWHVTLLAPWFENGEDKEQRGRFRVAVLDVGDVSDSLLQVPGYADIPEYPAHIKDNAARYARLGRDDNGNALVPEVMVQLVRMDVPSDFTPCPLPEAR